MENKQLIEYAINNNFEITVEEINNTVSFIWSNGSHCITTDKDEAKELMKLLPTKEENKTLFETLNELFGNDWETKNKTVLSLMTTKIEKVSKYNKGGKRTTAIHMNDKTVIEATQKMTGKFWVRIPTYI